VYYFLLAVFIENQSWGKIIFHLNREEEEWTLAEVAHRHQTSNTVFHHYFKTQCFSACTKTALAG
jgi:hypothetical protein